MMQVSSKPGPDPLRTWAAVLALLIAATLAGVALDQHVSLTSQAMLYVLAVVIAATTLTTLSSVVCALGAVTAFNFFFVPPRWTFEVESQEHLLALGTMLVVALAISHLTAKLRIKSEMARRNAQRAHQLQALAGGLANATAVPEAGMLGAQALEAAFAGPSMLATTNAAGVLESTSNRLPDLQDGLTSCMREAATLGPGTGRWPGLNAWYIPLGSAGNMHGAACIENVQAADEEGREHAQALCLLLAQAMARIKMMAAIQASHLEAQRQQMQSTFLAAISHDLRTPLAAVVGAASALQSQGDKLSHAEQQRLLGSIVGEAHYLSNVTENTLQLVQLTNAAAPLRRDWESMEEIAGAVLARLRLRDTRRRISARIAKELPLIEVDPVLIAQLMGNLLDNALKYSDGPVELVVRTTQRNMVVIVKDRGHIIEESLRESIFQPYARGDRSGQRGAGLGLALCRAIAQVHDGSLTVRARQGGGNSFGLTLALNPVQPDLGAQDGTAEVAL